MKKFPKFSVMTAGGPVRVVTFAEFSRNIGGIEVLFRVTSPVGDSVRALGLTHVETTRLVGKVEFLDIAKTRDSQFVNNYEKAGNRVLNRILRDVGDDRFVKAVKRYS